jgi:CRP-like cAMP-binding protein
MIWIDREIDNVLEFDKIYRFTENGALIDTSDTHTIAPQNLDDTNILIGQSGLFGSLDAHIQQLLSEQSHRVTVKAGEFVYRQGQVSRNVFLIIKGNAHSLRDENDLKKIASNLVEGEGFGLMDVLALRPRAMSVKAVTNLELLRINGEAIQEIIEGDTAIIQSLLRAITEQWSSVSR